MYIYYYYYYYSALVPVWAGTRAQSGDRYDSGTLHPGQVLRGSLPLLSPMYIYIHIYTHTHTHSLKRIATRTNRWPINKTDLLREHYKKFTKFTH
jgi:hypothetical protein